MRLNTPFTGWYEESTVNDSDRRRRSVTCDTSERTERMEWKQRERRKMDEKNYIKSISNSLVSSSSRKHSLAPRCFAVRACVGCTFSFFFRFQLTSVSFVHLYNVRCAMYVGTTPKETKMRFTHTHDVKHMFKSIVKGFFFSLVFGFRKTPNFLGDSERFTELAIQCVNLDVTVHSVRSFHFNIFRSLFPISHTHTCPSISRSRHTAFSTVTRESLRFLYPPPIRMPSTCRLCIVFLMLVFLSGEIH